MASLARRDLADFVEFTSPWKLEDWQRQICARLQRLENERGQRILIHAPPQFGKSILVSQRFPAWIIGRQPNVRVRLTCYNISHAERFSKTIKQVMETEEYRETFPDPRCRIPKICLNEEWWTAQRKAQMDAQPSFKALGLATGFVGLGAEILIIDDPYASADEAFSEAVNANIWEWWTQTARPRVDARPETNIVVMFHRWRDDDFTGRLQREGGWETMRFPAIGDGRDDDPTGRVEGEPLSPRYPVENLRIFEARDPQTFFAQFQGRPIKDEGNFIRAARIQHAEIRPNTFNYSTLNVYQGWDLAISLKQMADYTVCATIGVDPDQNLYILDIRRERLEFNPTVEAMAEQYRVWSSAGDDLIPANAPGRIAIETTGYQAVAFQQARGRYMLPFVETKPGKDKVTRAQLLADRIAMGKVYANKTAEWWPEFYKELLAFPGGRHDDQVDAVVMALALHPIGDEAKSEAVKPPPMSVDRMDWEREQVAAKQRKSRI